jgi:hypothetical protein
LIAKSSGIKLRSGSLEKKADNVVEAVPLNDNNNN